MRTRWILPLAALCSGILACSEESTPAPQASPAASVAPVSAPKAFTPAANGMVSAQQANLYRDASDAIMQLQQKWNERIAAAQGQQKILILQGYESAREAVCVKLGLAGWPEYRWNDSVIVLPVNQATAQAAGIVVRTK